MCVDLHVKFSLLLSDFNETWIFSVYFRQNFMKIRQVGSGFSMRTDRHDEASGRFSQFCEKRQKSTVSFCQIWGSQSGVTEDSSLFRSYTASTGKHVTTFRRTVVHSSSRSGSPRRSRFLHCLTLMLNALWSLETSFPLINLSVATY